MSETFCKVNSHFFFFDVPQFSSNCWHIGWLLCLDDRWGLSVAYLLPNYLNYYSFFFSNHLSLLFRDDINWNCAVVATKINNVLFMQLRCFFTTCFQQKTRYFAKLVLELGKMKIGNLISWTWTHIQKFVKRAYFVCAFLLKCYKLHFTPISYNWRRIKNKKISEYDFQ